MLVLLAALHMMLPLTRAVTCKKAKQQLPNRTISPDRKYSVVLYGIEECPQEKHAQLQSDLKHVVSVMSNVYNTICYEFTLLSPREMSPIQVCIHIYNLVLKVHRFLLKNILMQ